MSPLVEIKRIGKEYQLINYTAIVNSGDEITYYFHNLKKIDTKVFVNCLILKL